MKILVVSATEKEIFPLKSKLKSDFSPGLSLDFLITGIGSVFTSYHLLRKLNENEYDYVINAGIAGSFSNDFQIGDVVFIESDQFADLAIEDQDKLFTIFEKDYADSNQFPFTNGYTYHPCTREP